MKAGDLLFHKTSHPYKDNGTKKSFNQEVIVKVTKVDGNNAEYEVVEVLKEEDRPSWDSTNFRAGSKGGFSISANERFRGFVPYAPPTPCALSSEDFKNFTKGLKVIVHG